MKKINILLSGLALCGMMLSSCHLDQELPPIAYPEGGSAETMGEGTWDNPYHVWQILLGTDAGTDAEGNPRDYAWVTGYIVGYISTSAGVYTLNENTAVFNATGAENSNIILAETPEERNWEKCISVQLPSGKVRNAVNLQQNPDNLGKEITLYGTLGVKYMGAYGVKNCEEFEWGSEGFEIDNPSGGGSGGTITNGTSFLTGNMDNFTIDNVNLPNGLDYIWSWDSYNYAKASAYKSGNYAAEAYLISPAITLPSTSPGATFSQAINYLNGNNRADFLNVCVREGNSGAWTTVEVSAWPAGTGWNFTDNCFIDLSAFAGKTVQIAFHYKSTSNCATTWEVKNLVVGTANK